MRIRFMGLALTALIACGVARPLHASIVYTHGHGDFGVAYEDGDFFLHYHIGGDSNVPEGEYDPSAIAVRVADSLYIPSVPTGFGFTGVTPSDNDLWVLPQSNTPGVPFLGIATEEAGAPSDWVGGINFKLTGMSFQPQGSGVAERANFSLWSQGFTSTVHMATADGIGGEDLLNLSAGAHNHYNFGFTEEGLYEIAITAYGTHVTDGYFEDSGTMRFLVGDNTVAAVPEPSSWVILSGLAGLGLVGHLRRRRKLASAAKSSGSTC